MRRRTVGSSLLLVGLLALATAAAAQTAMPPGDSYLCYKAGIAPGEAKFSPVEKTLQDQLGTVVADVKKVATLCNPMQTAGHPNVHGVGYKFVPAKSVSQVKFVKADHTAIDQFGTHPVTLVKPIEVRAPSAMVLGPGGTGFVDTTGVDHFECYKAVAAKGAPKFVPPEPLAITDALGTQSYALKKITKLCTPVNKDGEDPTAPEHLGHLACYLAKPATKAKFTKQTVSVNNSNFGPSVLLAKAVLEVCVPAYMDTVPAPTPTPVPTPTPAPTPVPTPFTCSSAQPCPGGVQCCSGTCLPPDSFCRRVCSVSTRVQCLADADCEFPKCLDCFPLSGQTCLPPQIIPNNCGGGTCLVGSEICCSAQRCCRTYDQACAPATGLCNDICPSGTFACGDTCCLNAQTCVSGACKTSCGAVVCEPGTETCCGSTCCNTATQVCGAVPNTCKTRATCTGTDVYIPSTDRCCPQLAACGGNSACCDLNLQHCDTGTGKCVANF